jgi:hypothetical protein
MEFTLINGKWIIFEFDESQRFILTLIFKATPARQSSSNGINGECTRDFREKIRPRFLPSGLMRRVARRHAR